MRKLLLFSAAIMLTMSFGFARVYNNVVYDEIDAPVLEAGDAQESFDMVAPQTFVRVGNRIVVRPELTAEEGAPGTFYQRPRGTFYCGISTLNKYYPNNYAYVPLFRDLTWKNYSTGATSYEWLYSNPEKYNDTLCSNDKDLTLWYEIYGTAVYPNLKATNEAGDSTYRIAAYMRCGGPVISTSTSGIFGATNYDPINWSAWKRHSGISGTNNATVNSRYTKQYAEYGIDTVYVTGFAERNDKPLSPYLLNGVYAHMYVSVGGPLNLKVYQAVQDEDGSWSLGELITESSTTVEAGDPVIAQFTDLVYRDEETGLDEGDVLIDGPIFTIIEAGDDNVTFMPLYRTHTKSLVGESHAYNYIKLETEGFEINDVVSANYRFTANDGSNSYNTAWSMGYDILQSYLYSKVDTVEVPDEGLEQEFVFKSYYRSTTWDIQVLNAEETVDWISVGAPVDSLSTNASGATVFTGKVTVPITFEARPDDTRYREADVVISISGAEFTIHCTQGRPPIQGTPGDVNDDGSINAGDVSAIYNVILGVETDESIINRADVNDDGSVNAGDVSADYQYILNGDLEDGVE